MTSETCANCGRIKGDHYGSLCFCYDDDMTGRADKFIPQKQETCAKCGHGSKFEVKHCCVCKCKKFKPSQGMTQEVPQNHSPQTNTRKVIVSGDKTEDKEPEEIKTETQVVNDRINSSGSDDICSCGHFFSIHHAGTDFSCWNTHCKCKQFKPRNDVCKEVNKIEKNFNNKINKLKKEHGKD